jgi:hypothetical protein
MSTGPSAPDMAKNRPKGKEHIDYDASIGDRKDATPAIRAEQASLDETLTRLHDRYRPGVVTQSDSLYPDSRAPSAQFPAKLTAKDPHDERIALKASLIGNRQTGATPFGMATMTDEDLAWIERKRQMQNYLALNAYIDNCELRFASLCMLLRADRRSQTST